jgi:glycosyltransferase involved in cell wall biosynthesis
VSTTTLPQPDRRSGDRHLFALLEILAKNHRIDFCLARAVPFSTPDVRRLNALLSGIGVRYLGQGWSRLARIHFLRWYDVGLFYFYNQVEDLLPAFKGKQPFARTIVHSMDVHFARERAGAELGLFDGAAALQTEARELAAYRAVDAVLTASAPDAELLTNAGGIANVVVFPVVVDIRERPPRARQQDVLFIGDFKHLPNVDGMRWFVRDVWPHVLQGVPAARLQVVGAEPPEDLISMAQATSGVSVLGRVPDTAPYLDAAAVSIAPLRYGGGMKGKVVEALASAVPVVSTTVGIQGLSVQPGHDILVADDLVGFSHHVITLLSNPETAEAMGARGQQVASLLCDRNVLSQRLDELLLRLVPKRNALLRSITWSAAAPGRALDILLHRVGRKANA